MRIADVNVVLGGGKCLELLVRVESNLTPELDTSLVSVRETAPGAGTWSPPKDLGSPDPGLVGFATGTAVGVNVDGRLDVAVREKGGRLGFISQLPPDRHWSGVWKSLKRPTGTELFSAPACISDALGRLTVFAVGEDGAVWFRRQPTPGTGPWLPWASLGEFSADSPLQEAPAVARNADGRLEVFRMSPTGKVRHVRQTAVDGPWSAWEDLGGAFGSRAPVQPVLRADGRLEVSVLSSAEAVDDALLWSKEQLEPGGPDWSPGWRGADLGIPGRVPDRSAAAVGSHADGRPVVLTGIFETGETTVWLTERTATGGHARQLTDLPASGRIFDGPELVRDATGRLVLLWIGDLDTLVRGLRQTEPNGETWSPFTIDVGQASG